MTGAGMRSGELARRAGVSADTLRHYERRGLLPAAPRSAAGYRRFPEEALTRVQVIRAALSMGFSLEELGGILRTRDAGGAPCREVYELAEQKLALLQARIAEMEALRVRLRAALRGWRQRLKAMPQPGAGRKPARARLLEAFASAYPESTRSVSPLLSPSLQRHLSRKEDSR